MENNEKEREIITTEEDIDEKNDPENNKNKKYDESRVYYVYKHVRLDNNTCFYIGKGKNGRKDVPNRNPTHDSICDRHGYKVVIFKNKLNEAEAFKLEEDLIRCYVFKMGYGILIKGYMNNNNKFLTNRTWGGEGVSVPRSEETKQRMSKSQKGHAAWNFKKIICITTGETFDSQTEAAIHYNVAQSSISKCCKGELKSAGELNGVRLQWKYLEDYDDNESKAV